MSAGHVPERAGRLPVADDALLLAAPAVADRDDLVVPAGERAAVDVAEADEPLTARGPSTRRGSRRAARTNAGWSTSSPAARTRASSARTLMPAAPVISSLKRFTHEAKSAGMRLGGMGSLSHPVSSAHMCSTSSRSGGTYSPRLACARKDDSVPASAPPAPSAGCSAVPAHASATRTPTQTPPPTPTTRRIIAIVGSFLWRTTPRAAASFCPLGRAHRNLAAQTPCGWGFHGPPGSGKVRPLP